MLSVNSVEQNQDCSEFAAEDTKEDECPVPTFQWVTGRREVDRPLGVSIDFDDKNNLVRVVDVFEDSLAGEKNRRIRAILELCVKDLRPGDIEIVNELTDHVEIQQDFRSAVNIHMKILRKE